MPKRGGPCNFCGHTRADHIHDMGKSDDNQGVEDLRHCRVKDCGCQDYGDGVAGGGQ